MYIVDVHVHLWRIMSVFKKLICTCSCTYTCNSVDWKKEVCSSNCDFKFQKLVFLINSLAHYLCTARPTRTCSVRAWYSTHVQPHWLANTCNRLYMYARLCNKNDMLFQSCSLWSPGPLLEQWLCLLKASILLQRDSSAFSSAFLIFTVTWLFGSSVLRKSSSSAQTGRPKIIVWINNQD